MKRKDFSAIAELLITNGVGFIKCFFNFSDCVLTLQDAKHFDGTPLIIDFSDGTNYLGSIEINRMIGSYKNEEWVDLEGADSSAITADHDNNHTMNLVEFRHKEFRNGEHPLHIYFTFFKEGEECKGECIIVVEEEGFQIFD